MCAEVLRSTIYTSRSSSVVPEAGENGACGYISDRAWGEGAGEEDTCSSFIKIGQFTRLFLFNICIRQDLRCHFFGCITKGGFVVQDPTGHKVALFRV